MTMPSKPRRSTTLLAKEEGETTVSFTPKAPVSVRASSTQTTAEGPANEPTLLDKEVQAGTPGLPGKEGQADTPGSLGKEGHAGTPGPLGQEGQAGASAAPWPGEGVPGNAPEPLPPGDGGPGNEPGPLPPGEGEAVEAPEPTVTRQTLEQTPGRSLVFLRGVGTSASIRAALARRGYTRVEHERGWALLLASSGQFEDPGAEDVDDLAVQQAIADVDAWDEDGLRIVNASLRGRHPAQHAFVMRGLKASTGIAAVLGVATLLDRLDALESAPEREITRKGDHAALATLAARGIGKAERARLRAKVKLAQSFAGTRGPAEQAAYEQRVRQALVEQRRWFEEWADVARAVIKRRDQLIRLGLASRRPRQGDGAPVEVPGDDAPVEEPGDDEGAE